MKNNLKIYLESQVKIQQWIRNNLTKKMEVPKVINLLSISSVRQLQILKKQKK